MTAVIPELSRPVRTDQIPATGMTLDIEAQPAELDALAERFGVPSIGRLSAQVTLKAIAGGALVRVDGTFSAQVVQTCVVTLEPVEAELEDAFTLTYGAPEPEQPGEEIELSLDEEDPPDPIIDGLIDVGEAVAEHVALALDPFPRKPGISFDDVSADAARGERKTSPFAVLEQLRKNKG